MYATVADLRAEGVTAAQGDDARLARLSDEASALIDRLAGWFFAPRERTFRMSGRGTATVEPPVPPIRLDRLTVGGVELPTAEVILVGAPAEPGFDAPLLALRGGVFPRGVANLEASGLWGYTEPDGTPFGSTPPAIRRATMLLVRQWLAPLASTDADDARLRARLIEERTRDQAYRLAPMSTDAALVGDPDLADLLAPYCRPMGLGAV